ncbi:MAG TPA: prepilin-type N-terminal cleavage/methylation domain-containing protein [Pyrinomonadaceae bacterium]|jgi:type II secretory pathway pseudopilin PulG|nr:prepilin-type N-terminal cleavage/methylation domain-containing protein [Pyrinomonadaceae bacterium]
MKMRRANNEGGFSLVELILAMAITLTVLGLSSTLLAAGFYSRSREDRKSDGIADVQRALNIMTREIGNSGLKLPTGLGAVATNGIVTNDSDNQSIRIVSNLNGMPDSANGYFEDPDVEDTDEDLKFLMYVDAALGQRYIVRYERNGSNQTTVLANRIDSLIFRYYDEKVTYSTTVDSNGVCDITDVKNAAGNSKSEVSPASAKFIVIAVGVTLPAVGSEGSEGYQPPSQVQLTSDVVLRNSIVY